MIKSGHATRYYAPDGRYLPGASDARLTKRKERVLEHLARVHEDLAALGRAHSKTAYGCLQSGECCRVGLMLHTAEIELMARHVEARTAGDPAARSRVVAALERACRDPAWTWKEGVGDLACAFYAEGCTIYPARPAVCRMYGTILELDDDCPRRRLASGRDFVWIHPRADGVVKELYRVVDDYGRLFPRADRTRYMPAGLLMFLLPRKELRKIRARTPERFWKSYEGYRTQFVPSARKPGYDERVPRFPLTLRLGASSGDGPS